MNNTNQARQILMNELGMTRESVRALAVDIVTSTVQKQIEDSSYLRQLIQAIVRESLTKLVTRSPFSGPEDPLVSLCRTVLKDECARIVMQRVQITVAGEESL